MTEADVAIERVWLGVWLGVADADLVAVRLGVRLALFERERVGDEDAVADRDGVRGPSMTTRPHDADDATPETQNGDDIPVLRPGLEGGALSPEAPIRFRVKDEPPPAQEEPPPPPKKPPPPPAK